jgi:hypothetical protein
MSRLLDAVNANIHIICLSQIEWGWYNLPRRTVTFWRRILTRYRFKLLMIQKVILAILASPDWSMKWLRIDPTREMQINLGTTT